MISSTLCFVLQPPTYPLWRHPHRRPSWRAYRLATVTSELSMAWPLTRTQPACWRWWWLPPSKSRLPPTVTRETPVNASRYSHIVSWEWRKADWPSNLLLLQSHVSLHGAFSSFCFFQSVTHYLLISSRTWKYCGSLLRVDPRDLLFLLIVADWKRNSQYFKEGKKETVSL